MKERLNETAKEEMVDEKIQQKKKSEANWIIKRPQSGLIEEGNLL